MSQADLEMSLYRREARSGSVSYGVKLRFTDRQREADKRQRAPDRSARMNSQADTEKSAEADSPYGAMPQSVSTDFSF